MYKALQVARGFDDLVRSGNEVPYDFRSIFVPEGMFARRRENARLKLLRALDERIRAVLEDGETVRLVSSGIENSFFEQMFIGWMVYYMNRTAFVLTDRRLLLLQITGRRKPATFIKQYRFDGIRNVGSGMGRTLKVTGTDGKTTAFARLPGKDGRRLAALLRESANPTPGVHAGKQNVCPACFAPISGVPDACECGQAFKSPRKAGLLSLVFPGLGDLYLGHYGFAAVELFAGALFWSTLVLGFIEPAPDGTQLSPAAAVLMTGIVLVPFFHIPDAFATWRIGSKGLVPRTRADAMVGLAAPGAMKWKS